MTDLAKCSAAIYFKVNTVVTLSWLHDVLHSYIVIYREIFQLQGRI